MGRRRDPGPDLFGWADERAAEDADRAADKAREDYRIAPHGERTPRMKHMRAAVKTALQARLKTMGHRRG